MTDRRAASLRRPARPLASARATRIAALGALLFSVTLGAQERAPLLPQWELRGDLVGRRDPSVELGVGVNLRTGSYVRAGALLAGGVGAHGGAAQPTARLDATIRYLLDPFSEGRWGLYGGGGLTVYRDARNERRAAVLLVAGIEGARAHRWTPALEIGLGGGVRLGAVWRSRRPGRSR